MYPHVKYCFSTYILKLPLHTKRLRCTKNITKADTNSYIINIPK